MYSNVDSLLNKRSELAEVIKTTQPDIICITEFLPKNSKFEVQESELTIENYNKFSNLQYNTCRRGVLVYFNAKLNVSQVNMFSTSIESVNYELNIQSETLFIGLIYRSPNSNNLNDETINQNILSVSHTYSRVIILGDFNYLDWTDTTNPFPRCTKFELFIETIRASFLHQHL